MIPNNTKILIVGAGPTGLTAAVELARQGIIPTIIDKRSRVSNLSRAVGITPKSLAILSQCGVDKRLIAEGIAIQNSHVFIHDRLSLSVKLHSARSHFHTLLGLPQDRTEKVLLDKFKSYGGTVNYGVEFINYQPIDPEHGHNLHVYLRQTNESKTDNVFEENFDFIFGADGINSQVRKTAQIPYIGYDLRTTWSIADVNINNWPYPNDFCLFKLPKGQMMVVVAIGKNRYRMVSNTHDSIAALPLQSEITHTHREGTFNIAVRQAKTYAKDHVFIGGDAAHCHSPVGGRGMNLGIADAAQWVACLVEGRLDNYTEIRHKAGQKIIKMSERGRRMISSKSWFKNTLFKLFIGTAKHVNWIKKRFSQFIIEF